MAIRRLDRPVFSPTRCLCCGQNTHPDGFIDFGVEAPEMGHTQDGKLAVRPGEWVAPVGHLYLCAGCVQTAAAKVGCLAPAETADLVAEVADLGRQVKTLADQLEQAQADRVVSLEDARALLHETKPKAKPAAKKADD